MTDRQRVTTPPRDQLVPQLSTAHGSSAHDTARLAVVVGALGVVFGDIGTSPIYTLQTVFSPSDPHPVPVSTRQRVRRGVAGVLVRDDHRHGHLRAARDARRQRRRGRHHGADHAAAPVGRAARPAGRARAGGAGHLRRLAVLRRQHDHPGDLGALRGRGPQGRRALAGRPCRADHRGDHRAAVPGAAPGHRGGRPGVRTGDDRLVHGHRRVRRRPASPATPRSSRRCRRPTR